MWEEVSKRPWVISIHWDFCLPPLDYALNLLSHFSQVEHAQVTTCHFWDWVTERQQLLALPLLQLSSEKPVALQRGPCCKELWEVDSRCAQQPARDRNRPTAMCVNREADLPSEEPFEKTTALVNALAVTLYEIMRKRHPAKPHLDFCPPKHGKIVNVCCFKWLSIGVKF